MTEEDLIKEKDKLIKVLKDQIALKDKQLDELIKAYGNILVERDSYKKAIESL